MNPHLGRHQIGHGYRSAVHVFAVQQAVNRHRCLVTVRHRRDDVLRTVRRVTAKKHIGQRGLERIGHQYRQTPFIKLDTDIALDPGEGVLLTDGNQDRITFHQHIRHAGGYQRAATFFVIHRFHNLKAHAGQFALDMFKRLGHMEVQNRNTLVQRIFFLPGRSLHLFKAAAHDHLHVAATHAPRRAAAIHRSIATTEHNDTLADAGDMTKGNRSQPVDADMNVFLDVPASGNIEIATAGRATANKDGVVAFRQELAHGLNALAALELHTQIQDVAGLLVDHRLR